MRKSALLAAAAAACLAFAAGAASAATVRNYGKDVNGSRYTDALNLLEAKGYVTFTDFHKVGDQFQASVTQKGKQMTVMIDPDNQTVQVTH